MADGQDTEITLGTGRLLGLFFGLVVVCGVFFGLGFSLGRNSVKTGPLALEETPATTATPQSNAANKADAGTPERPASAVPIGQPATDAAQSTAGSAAAPVVASPASTATAGNTPAPEMTQPLAAGGTGYTVQVAAVSKQEDADALVDALKKKSYPVFIASVANDKLFHVQVGPFGDIKDAEAMKAKLLGDGYNPIVKR